MKEELIYHSCFSSHAIPQRLDPFSTKNTEDHHERVEKVSEIPPEREQINYLV